MILHKPVLVQAILTILKEYNVNTAIDVTFGGGNHARLFEEKLLFAMDRDIEAIQHNSSNVNLIIDKFSNLNQYITSPVDLVHADLGLSWMQIQSNRGFSFMTNSPLHMTASQGDLSLYTKINHMKKNEIAKILKEYGELKNFNTIAQNINEYRIHKNIDTTFDLIEACKINNFSTLAQIFQAFRIYNNNEIEELNALLSTCKLHCKMISIITFHSIEAKIVCNFMKIHCVKIKKFKPSLEEIKENPASRSAILYLGMFQDDSKKSSNKSKKNK